MKTYIASVRDKRTKKIEIIEREYPSAAAFRSDLYSNGYSVRFITTPDKFDEACEKWNDACERSNAVHKCIYACHKKRAEELGMTVAEYRTWLKEV